MKHIQSLNHRLSNIHHIVTWLISSMPWLCFVFVFIGYYSLLNIIEYHFYLSIGSKIFGWCVGLLIGIGMIFFIKRNFHSMSYKQFYSRLATSMQLPQLMYGLDFVNYKRYAQSIFYNNAIKQNSHAIKNQVSFYHLRKVFWKEGTIWLSSCAGIILILSIMLITWQDVSLSSNRLIHFWKTYLPPNPYDYVLLPGDVTIQESDNLKTSIVFNSRIIPENISFWLKKENDEDFYAQLLTQDEDDKRFFYHESQIFDDVEYYFKMDGYVTDVYRIHVLHPPQWDSLSLAIAPPQYTNIEPTRLDYPFKKISVYEGSRLMLKAKPKQTLSTVLLKSQNERLPIFLNQDDGYYTYSWTAEKKDSLSYELRSDNQSQNSDPYSINVEILRDKMPDIVIESPDTYQKIEPDDVKQIIYTVNDDFGINSVELYVDIILPFQSNSIQKKYELKVPNMKESEVYEWDLKPYNLVPNSQIKYYIAVTDNDEINEYKTTKTSIYTFEVPSLADSFTELQDREYELTNDFETANLAYQNVINNFNELFQSLVNNPSDVSQNQHQTKVLQQSWQKMIQEMEKLNRKYSNLYEGNKQKKLLSSETMNLYNELQDLMKEVNNPTILKNIEQMRKSFAKMSPKLMKNAMQQYKFEEDHYKAGLDRAVNLFKKLQVKKNFDKIDKLLQNSIDTQKKLLESGAMDKKSAQHHKDIMNNIDQIKKDLDEMAAKSPAKLQKDLEHLNAKENPELTKLKKELEEISKDMERHNKELQSQSGDSKEKAAKTKEIQKKQKETIKKLEDIKKRINSFQKEMEKKERKVSIATLGYILEQLLLLSYHQENIIKHVQNLSNDNESYKIIAQDIHNAQQFYNQVIDSLQEVSIAIPQISSSVLRRKERIKQHYNQSIDRISEKNPKAVNPLLNKIYSDVNVLSSDIVKVIEQVNQQQSSNNQHGSQSNIEKIVQELQKFGQNQRQFNQQLQNFINSMQGNRLGAQQINKMQQLAQMQNSLRKQLKQLINSQKSLQGNQVGNSLKETISKMEETINELHTGVAYKPVVNRQQDILTRLLEAEKSVRERDKDEKREGKTAEKIVRDELPQLDMDKIEKEARQQLKGVTLPKFQLDLQNLTENYLRMLRIRNKE